MVQIAERASILDQEADKILLMERANHLWDRPAIFEWNVRYFYSYSPSNASDDDPIDEEGDGSGFNSQTRQDDAANDHTELEPPSTLQQPPYAQEIFTYQPAPLLDPSWTTCHLCSKALTAKADTFCESCSRHSLAYATHELPLAFSFQCGHASSSNFGWEHNKKSDASQRRAEVTFHDFMDDTSYHHTQHFGCLGCGTTDLWPGASFCLSCTLNWNPPEDLFGASFTTSSAGDHIEPPTGVLVPNEGAPLSHSGEIFDFPSVRAAETRGGSPQELVRRSCAFWPHGDCGDKGDGRRICEPKREKPLV